MNSILRTLLVFVVLTAAGFAQSADVFAATKKKAEAGDAEAQVRLGTIATKASLTVAISLHIKSPFFQLEDRSEERSSSRYGRPATIGKLLKYTSTRRDLRSNERPPTKCDSSRPSA